MRSSASIGGWRRPILWSSIARRNDRLLTHSGRAGDAFSCSQTLVFSPTKRSIEYGRSASLRICDVFCVDGRSVHLHTDLANLRRVSCRLRELIPRVSNSLDSPTLLSKDALSCACFSACCWWLRSGSFLVAERRCRRQRSRLRQPSLPSRQTAKYCRQLP